MATATVCVSANVKVWTVMIRTGLSDHIRNEPDKKLKDDSANTHAEHEFLLANALRHNVSDRRSETIKHGRYLHQLDELKRIVQA